MRPVDYRGRVLYDEVWDRVYFYGAALLERGYVEATSKWNLFLLAYPTVTFFAGLRGTKDIDIWEDRRPLFWWQLAKGRRVASEQLARMVTIEASRLDPIPIRTTHMPSEDTLPVFARIDSQGLFDRPEPDHVPKAPHVSAISWRLHLYKAIDGKTGEYISASDTAAARPYLRCTSCRERLARRWDPDLQRYFFDHKKGRCAMQSVW